MKNVNVDIGGWVPHSNDDTPDMTTKHSTNGLNLRHSQDQESQLEQLEINLGSAVYAALLLPCIIVNANQRTIKTGEAMK